MTLDSIFQAFPSLFMIFSYAELPELPQQEQRQPQRQQQTRQPQREEHNAGEEVGLHVFLRRLKSEPYHRGRQ